MGTYKLGISSQARSPHPLPGPQLKGSVLAYCFCPQVPLCQLPVSFTLKIQHTQGHLQHFRPLGYSTVAPSSYTLTVSVTVSTKWGTHFIHTHCHCVNKVGTPISYTLTVTVSTKWGTHFIHTHCHCVNKVGHPFHTHSLSVSLCQQSRAPISYTLTVTVSTRWGTHFIHSLSLCQQGGVPISYTHCHCVNKVGHPFHTLTVIASTKWGTHFIQTHCHCVNKVGHPFHTLTVNVSTKWGYTLSMCQQSGATHSLSLCQQSGVSISYTLTVIVSTKWGTHFIQTHYHCVNKLRHRFY